MYEADLAKEYLRDAFMGGYLDIGRSPEMREGFIRIFQGEMESLIAIDHAGSLEESEVKRLLKIAKPTAESVAHLKAWKDRIHG